MPKKVYIVGEVHSPVDPSWNSKGYVICAKLAGLHGLTVLFEDLKGVGIDNRSEAVLDFQKATGALDLSDGFNRKEAFQDLFAYIKEANPTASEVDLIATTKREFYKEKSGFMVAGILEQLDRHDSVMVVVGAKHIPSMVKMLEERYEEEHGPDKLTIRHNMIQPDLQKVDPEYISHAKLALNGVNAEFEKYKMTLSGPLHTLDEQLSADRGVPGASPLKLLGGTLTTDVNLGPPVSR